MMMMILRFQGYDCLCSEEGSSRSSHYFLSSMTFRASFFFKKKQAFPEATLHIVPDAGHSSREPGTTKLLVEVRTIQISYWGVYKCD